MGGCFSFCTCALLYCHCSWLLLSILLLGQSTSCNPSAAVHKSQSWRPHLISVSRNRCITRKVCHVTFLSCFMSFIDILKSKDPSTDPRRIMVTAFPLGKLTVQCSLSYFLNHYQSLRESFLPNWEGWRTFNKEHFCHLFWKIANSSLEQWLCPCDGWHGVSPGQNERGYIDDTAHIYSSFSSLVGNIFLWFSPVAESSCLRLVPYCHLSVL